MTIVELENISNGIVVDSFLKEAYQIGYLGSNRSFQDLFATCLV